MPVSGTLDVAGRLGDAPLAADLATEPVVCERAEVLQVMFEVEAAEVTSMLPRALHPTDPAVATFLWIAAPDSPLGPFALAQTRIGCRAGVRPRGFVLRTVLLDSTVEPGVTGTGRSAPQWPDASAPQSRVGATGDRAASATEDRLASAPQNSVAGALASGWGIGTTSGAVELVRGYDAIEGRVRVNGDTVLEAALVDPIPLSGAEIQLAASMQLARVARDGTEVARLVQFDPDLTFHRAARGRAALETFEAEAWGEARLRPVHPVSAWYALCDLTMPRVRYLIDPAVGALEGTERVAG